MSQLGRAGCVVAAVVACAAAHAQAVKDLSSGQVGRIDFESVDKATIRALIEGSAATPVTVWGNLSLPEGATGKVPAVVYLHTSGGEGRESNLWREKFHAMGAAFFSINSNTGRGVSDAGIPHIALQAADAYAALRLLVTHPALDPKRVVVAGSSLGGISALETTLAALAERLGGGARFAGAVGFYPAPCGLQYTGKRLGTPYLWFAAEHEDWSDPKVCKAYSEAVNAAGGNVRYMEVKDAYHGFDQLHMSVSRNYLTDGSCFARLDTVTWRAQRMDTGAALPDFAALRGYLKSCSRVKNASLKGSPAAFDRVAGEVARFLAALRQ